MDLQDPGGDKPSPKMSSEGGVVSKGSGRPIQKLKWRWHWKKKENQPPQVTQFSHNPPGHTCGLPCCIQDNEPQQALQRKSQTGCVTVPILSQADLSDSNFIMKRKQFPSNAKTDNARNRLSNNCDDDLVSGSDEDAEENEYTPRGIRLSSSSDAIPFVGVTGLRGEDYTNKAPDWPHYRKQQVISPSEQMRQRHITLPDYPETQHMIIFLSHQPGETEDGPDIRTPITDASKNQKVPETPHSQITPRGKSFNQNNELLVLKSQSGPVSPDEGYDKGDDFQNNSHKRRLVHSKLPEVPIESTDSGLAFEQEFRQISPDMDENDLGDNMSVYAEHVYDVLSEVKDSAYKLWQKSALGKPSSDILLPGSSSDLLQPRSDVLHRSVSELTLSDIDSSTFQGLLEDNDSCIYNGSLLSCGTNDSDVSLFYPSVIARHRYLMGHFDYPTSVLRREYFGSKLDQLSLSSAERDHGEGGAHDADNVSTASISNDSNAQLHGSKNWVDLGVPKPSIRVDEYDMSARFPVTSRYGLRTSRSSEFDLDSNTKLKLWDLRLSTVNREQNDYSTFPLRRFSSDDVSLGYFPDSHVLPYTQSNDVNIQKITNLIPSSILSNNIHRENTTLYFLSQCQANPFQNPDSTISKPKTLLEEWKKLFDTNRDTGMDSDLTSNHPTGSDNRLPANWIFPWREESEHEPIVFSGIYELFKSRQAAPSYTDSINSRSKCLEYIKNHEPPVGVQLPRKDNSTNPTIAFEPDNSIYGSYSYFGGSVSCSTSSFGSFAKRTACGSISSGSRVNSRPGIQGSRGSEGARQIPSALNTRPGPGQDNATVIMTKGQIVDWRRQAEFYRDNNFITLIL